MSARAGRSRRRVTGARRGAVVAVVTLVVAGLLAGCGFQARQQGAAIVNGQVIHEADVRKTAEQLKAAKFEFAEDIVVTALIASPLVRDAVDRSGGWEVDETYAATVAAMPEATDTTKEFVWVVALIQSARMTPEDVTVYRSNLDDADISVNPRFGTLRRSEEGPVYFTLGEATPNWIRPGGVASPTAREPAPATP